MAELRLAAASPAAHVLGRKLDSIPFSRYHLMLIAVLALGGFIASAISDHYSRKTIMLIGVAGLTFFTLMLTLVQTGEQLIIVRLLTGLAGGFAVFAPFPIAAELMPARHRRTFAAVYEMA